VVDASRIRFLVGWLPDNRRLVVTSLGPDGSMAQVVDVRSGEIQDLFNIDQVKGGFMKLSPDGNRVAYSELAFGTSSYSIYVANLDGSGKHLAVALDGGVTSGVWSPDGQWLAISVSSLVDGAELQTAAILNPDTCQVIPLAGIEGDIVSWVAE
jgi:Tol biopolymer transport system component